MNTYGAQMDRKWTGSVHLSVRTSVHPKHFPYLLDEPYARDLQAQGACALRFFRILWLNFGSYLTQSQVRTAPLLRLSHPFTCICPAGTNLGTDQTSTDVFEHGLSYLSISIFMVF